MMSDRWYCSLKQEVYPVRFVSVGETLSHPPVVFGFHPCGQFKDPWSLKSSKRKWVKVRERERDGKKKLGKPQRRLCLLVIGSAREGFSWKTARVWLETEGEWRERCELWLQGERSCKGLLGSLFVASPRAFLWLRCTQATKRGFLHLFIQFHAMSTPKWPHSLSKNAPSPPLWLATPVLPPKNT